MVLTEEQIAYIKELAKLLVDDGSNLEYTRGICELIADIDSRLDVGHYERSEEVRLEILG
jgi:hypothetical protein